MHAIDAVRASPHPTVFYIAIDAVLASPHPTIETVHDTVGCGEVRTASMNEQRIS